MWRDTSGRQMNGGSDEEEVRQRKSDVKVLSRVRRLHSSRMKRLNARRARTSACQS